MFHSTFEFVVFCIMIACGLFGFAYNMTMLFGSKTNELIVFARKQLFVSMVETARLTKKRMIHIAVAYTIAGLVAGFFYAIHWNVCSAFLMIAIVWGFIGIAMMPLWVKVYIKRFGIAVTDIVVTMGDGKVIKFVR